MLEKNILNFYRRITRRDMHMGLLNAIVFPFKKVQYLVEAVFQTSCAEIKFLKIITGFSFNSSYRKFFLYTIKK